MNVPQVEVRLEALRLEADRPLVERLGLDHLVARVVEVGEVDDRRDEVRIDHQGSPVRRRGSLHRPFVPVVETRGFDEEYCAADSACGSVNGNPRSFIVPAGDGSGDAGADRRRLRAAGLQRDDLGRGASLRAWKSPTKSSTSCP